MSLLHQKLKEHIKNQEFKYKTQQYKYIKNSIYQGFKDLELIVDSINDTAEFDMLIIISVLNILQLLKNKYINLNNLLLDQVFIREMIKNLEVKVKKEI